MRMFSKGFKFALVASATAALMACGGGSSTPAPLVAASNTTVAVAPANGSAVTTAVSGQTFSFPVGLLGSTTGATLKLTSGTTSTFEMKTGADTVGGTFTYGSCIFTVTSTTNAAKYAVGEVFVYNPCEFTVATAGATANGVATGRNVSIRLGRSTGSLESSLLNLPVTVNADGSVTIGGAGVAFGLSLVSGTGAGG